MGDRFSTHIIVGGPLKRDCLDEFLVLAADWQSDYGGSAVEREDVILAYSANEPLHLYDEEASVGQEEDLLTWAREHGLSYNFYQEGGGMYDNERRIFGRDPGAGEEHDSVGDGLEANMNAGQLKERAGWGLTLQDVIAQMEARDTFEVPPLELVD